MTVSPLPLLLISNALTSIATGVAMIAVPWFLVNDEHGSDHFAVLATTVNVGLMIFMPWAGRIIDCHSRKRLMILLRMAFAVAATVLLICSQVQNIADDRTLMAAFYAIGATFYAVNIPLRSAFVKEIFSEQHYVSVNSILEIENQVAAVVTGLIAILVVEKIGFHWLLSFNVAAYATAFLCIWVIPQPIQRPRAREQFSASPPLSTRSLLWRRRHIVLILMAGSLPYIVVILYGMLHPIAIAQLPRTSAHIYAVVELLFACGAIVAGIFTARTRLDNERLRLSLQWSLAFFAVVALGQGFFQSTVGFMLLAFGFGCMNGFARVLRQSILLHEFSASDLGRVAAFVQCWIMLCRAVFMVITVHLIGGDNVSAGIWFAAAIAVSAPLAVWLGPGILRRLAPSDHPIRPTSQEE